MSPGGQQLKRKRKKEGPSIGWLGSEGASAQLSSYQQVLWLDVTVDDVQTVQVFDGTGQVVEHPTGISLCVFASGSDGVKKVSALEESSWLSGIWTDGLIDCLWRGLTNQKARGEGTRIWGLPRAFSATAVRKTKDSLVISVLGMKDTDILS